MFRVNDYVVCGGNGVCQVKKIGATDFSGIDKDKLYYTLEPLYSIGSLLYIPVENCTAKMRKILSKDEARNLIDEIPNIEAVLFDDLKKQEEVYKEAMKSYDCREWVKIIKVLYLKELERTTNGKKLTTTDERYLQRAEDQLFGELAVSLDVSKENVEELVAQQVKG